MSPSEKGEEKPSRWWQERKQKKFNIREDEGKINLVALVVFFKSYFHAYRTHLPSSHTRTYITLLAERLFLLLTLHLNEKRGLS